MGSLEVLAAAASMDSPEAREFLVRTAAVLQARESLAECNDCKLGLTANRVPWAGPRGPLMIVGEAPGANEDAAGVPFVGQSGRVLNRALEAAGMSRSVVAVSNTIGCRPEHNDFNLAWDAKAPLHCRRHREAALDSSGAWLVCLLGGTALKVFNVGKNVGEARGTVWWGDDHRLYTASWHPAYVLRKPDKTPTLVKDLERARRLIQGATELPPMTNPPIECLGATTTPRSRELYRKAFRKYGYVAVHSPYANARVALTASSDVEPPPEMFDVKLRAVDVARLRTVVDVRAAVTLATLGIELERTGGLS